MNAHALRQKLARAFRRRVRPQALGQASTAGGDAGPSNPLETLQKMLVRQAVASDAQVTAQPSQTRPTARPVTTRPMTAAPMTADSAFPADYAAEKLQAAIAEKYLAVMRQLQDGQQRILRLIGVGADGQKPCFKACETPGGFTPEEKKLLLDRAALEREKRQFAEARQNAAQADDGRQNRAAAMAANNQRRAAKFAQMAQQLPPHQQVPNQAAQNPQLWRTIDQFSREAKDLKRLTAGGLQRIARLKRAVDSLRQVVRKHIADSRIHRDPRRHTSPAPSAESHGSKRISRPKQSPRISPARSHPMAAVLREMRRQTALLKRLGRRRRVTMPPEMWAAPAVDSGSGWGFAGRETIIEPPIVAKVI